MQKIKKRVAVPYFGGKFMLLDFILPHLPQTKIFVDVFGGGGSVVYNKPLSHTTVYNDKAKEIYTFFKVLREDYDSLAHLLKYTPFCYDLFKEAYSKLRKSKEPLTDLETAWYWFILIMQSFGHKGDGFSRGNKKKYPSTFINSVHKLNYLSDFFKGISIDNLDYKELILKYDTEDTLFYLDPPYLLDNNKKASEAYFHSFNLEQHQELISFIKTLKGKVCISHYQTSLYDQGFRDWHKAYKERKVTVNNLNKSLSKTIIVTEALYMNYDIQEIKNNENKNNKLFYNI